MNTRSKVNGSPQCCLSPRQSFHDSSSQCEVRLQFPHTPHCRWLCPTRGPGRHLDCLHSMYAPAFDAGAPCWAEASVGESQCAGPCFKMLSIAAKVVNPRSSGEAPVILRDQSSQSMSLTLRSTLPNQFSSAPCFYLQPLLVTARRFIYELAFLLLLPAVLRRTSLALYLPSLLSSLASYDPCVPIGASLTMSNAPTITNGCDSARLYLTRA